MRKMRRLLSCAVVTATLFGATTTAFAATPIPFEENEISVQLAARPSYNFTGDSYGSVSWSGASDAVYILVSVRDLTDNRLIVSRERISSGDESYTSPEIVAGHRYRIWVGAVYENGNEYTVGTHTFTAR